MRWFWVSSVLLAAAVASSFAQDAKPEGERFVVKARIKGVKPEPGVGALVTAWLEGDSPVIVASKSSFDRDGVLEALFTVPKSTGAGRIDIWFFGNPQVGHVYVFADALAGELDLGEVAVGESAKPLVAGRVVNAEGDPEYGVHVVVSCWQSRRHKFRFPELTATSDETGAFSVRGVVRGGAGLTLEMELDDGWTMESPIEFTAGATDVKVVATRTSGVHGTVVVPADLPLSDLVVSLSGPPRGVASAELESPNSGFARRGNVLEFPAAAAFVVSGLRPGSYDVRLKFAGSSRWLVRHPEVTIDDTARDLPALELKEPIKHAKARVAGADGAVPAGAELWARNDGDRAKFRPITLSADASADVAFVGEGVTLAARGEGTDFVRVTAKGGDVQAVLPQPSSSAVSIDLAEGAARTLPGYEVSVVLEWWADASADAAQARTATDDTDPRVNVKIEVPLPASGPAIAHVTVAGWYCVGMQTNRGTNRSTVFGDDRVRVERGKPATARLNMSPEEALNPFPPK